MRCIIKTPVYYVCVERMRARQNQPGDRAEMETKMKTIQCGFLDGNLDEAVDPNTLARSMETALRAKYPDCEIIVNHQRGQGSLPYDCTTFVYDEDGDYTSDYSDEIHLLKEMVCETLLLTC